MSLIDKKRSGSKALRVFGDVGYIGTFCSKVLPLYAHKKHQFKKRSGSKALRFWVNFEILYFSLWFKQ